MLVVYTTSARNAAGGAAQIEAEIAGAIDRANTSYLNSGISHRISLAGSALLGSDETSSFDSDLESLASTSDGKWDEVHTLRTQYAADMVAMIVDNDAYCGLGYLTAALTSSYTNYMFAEVSRICIDNESFTHELGHNMGADHDAANKDPSNGRLTSDALGWIFYGNNGLRYRTLMSYATTPSSQRIGYFSNPAVLYQGVATGSSSTANNARALELSMPYIANFLDDTGNVPGASPTAPPIPGATVSLAKQKNGRRFLLSGSLTDASALPVAAASITLQAKLTGQSRYKKVTTLTTDAAGAFSRNVSKTGRYRIMTSDGTTSNQVSVSIKSTSSSRR